MISPCINCWILSTTLEMEYTTCSELQFSSVHVLRTSFNSPVGPIYKISYDLLRLSQIYRCNIDLQ